MWPLVTDAYHDGRNSHHYTQEDDTGRLGKETCSDKTDNSAKEQKSSGKEKFDPIGLRDTYSKRGRGGGGERGRGGEGRGRRGEGEERGGEGEGRGRRGEGKERGGEAIQPTDSNYSTNTPRPARHVHWSIQCLHTCTGSSTKEMEQCRIWSEVVVDCLHQTCTYRMEQFH